MTAATIGKARILHVEVGGSYGGSLRALELYLQYANHDRFAHDMLFYYPTSGAERIAPLVDQQTVLYDFVPAWLTTASTNTPVLRELKESPLGEAIRAARRWTGAMRAMPLTIRLRKLLTSRRYDLVHVNNTFTYQTAVIMASRWADVPVVSHVRNPVPDSSFNRLLMRFLGMVVTVSENYEEELRKWNLPVAVHTCHDGIVAPEADVLAAAEIRRSFVTDDQILIGSVGRLHPQKGYDDLIRAARIVIDREPRIRVAISGEGPMRYELEAQIRNSGLSGLVHLCGFRSDISNFVSALDLFVSSSRWEGLPIAVVEAMLLRRPVVATDVGGVSEVVKNRKTGYLVSANDPSALADAMIDALEEQNIRPGAFIEEGRRIAAEVTDPVHCARAFEQRLSEVLKL